MRIRVRLLGMVILRSKQPRAGADLSRGGFTPMRRPNRPAVYLIQDQPAALEARARQGNQSGVEEN